LALVPALIFAVCDWISVATGRKKLEYVFKPLTLIALIVTAYLAGIDHTLSGDGETTEMATLYWILGALAFSLVGDVFLMLPSDRFVAGLAAFLIAHICYIAAFVDSFRAYRTYGVAVAVAVVGTFLFLRIRRGIVEKGKKGLLVPVTLYVLAISAMVTAAIGTLFPRTIGVEGFTVLLVLEVPWYERAGTAAAIGAVLFYISDALIGWTRFVRDFPQSRLAIMVTYHLGQMGFVLYLLRS
jgi:uncharacterized membrane protein YhhN